MTGGLNDSKVASRTHAMMSVDRPRSWRRGACHVLGIAGAGNCALTQLRGLNPPERQPGTVGIELPVPKDWVVERRVLSPTHIQTSGTTLFMFNPQDFFSNGMHY